MVLELFLLENVDCLLEKYDDVEFEEEFMFILEEIIMEDKKKIEGEVKLYMLIKCVKLIWVYSLLDIVFNYVIFVGLFYLGRRI